jgi:hypothetical protein
MRYIPPDDPRTSGDAGDGPGPSIWRAVETALDGDDDRSGDPADTLQAVAKETAALWRRRRHARLTHAEVGALRERVAAAVGAGRPSAAVCAFLDNVLGLVERLRPPAEVAGDAHATRS